MVATTNQKEKARMLDLVASVMELVRDGKRDIRSVCGVLQVIKDHPDFDLKLDARFLRFERYITRPATREPFVVQEQFVADVHGEIYVSPGFKELFYGKTEAPMPVEIELRCSKLVKPSLTDGPILAEVGDEGEIGLAQIHGLIGCQKNGEEGDLLTNGLANVFYARAVNGDLCAVRIYRYRWWFVDANVITFSAEWGEGCRVFSRVPLRS